MSAAIISTTKLVRRAGCPPDTVSEFQHPNRLNVSAVSTMYAFNVVRLAQGVRLMLTETVISKCWDVGGSKACIKVQPRLHRALAGQRLLLYIVCSTIPALSSAQFDTMPEVGTEFLAVQPDKPSASATQLQPGVQLSAPWHLDRIDQRKGPLDGVFYGQVCKLGFSGAGRSPMLFINLLTVVQGYKRDVYTRIVRRILSVMHVSLIFWWEMAGSSHSATDP